MSITPNNTINGIPVPIKPNCTFLTIGSAALPFSSSKDIDLVTYKDSLSHDNCQWNIKEHSASTSIQDTKFDVVLADKSIILQELLMFGGSTVPKFDPYVCYLFKAAHVHIQRKGKSWEKDIHDFHVLKTIVTSLDPEYNVFAKTGYKGLYEYNNQNHNVHTMNLNQSRKDFFNDGVIKYIDHDRLHELYAHGPLPVYKLTQYEGQGTVKCHEDLFNSLDWKEKLNMALEETYVIAAERFVIPRYVKGTSHVSKRDLHEALIKVCTTLSSGWFRQFCLNNYYTLFNLLDKNRFQLLTEELVFFEIEAKRTSK